jgi:predicted ATPase
MVFTTPTAGKTLLSLKEKNLERAITIEHISDGTLRFLLLMSIFYNPERGRIICLDEPEIGLHPDMINAVCKGIQYAAQHGTQVIVATHSPLLMNGFVLEDLLVFEKDQQNNTIVAAKSEDEFEGWEGDFLVGQMWLRGQIGGTRW